MRQEVHIKIIAVAMVVAGLALLIATLNRLRFFDALFQDPDLLLFASGISYAAIGILLGFYSKQIAKGVSKLSGRRRVVISYSTDDVEYVAKLRDGLRRRRILSWSDLDELRAGDVVMKILAERLEEADALVLFLTPDFVDFEKDLVKIARAKEKRIIPVQRADEYADYLKDVLHVPKPDDPEALAELVERAL